MPPSHLQRPLDGWSGEQTLDELAASLVEHNGNPFAVLRREVGIRVDVDDRNGEAAPAGMFGNDRGRLIAQVAIRPRQEGEGPGRSHAVATLRPAMRPVTALVLVGLLAVIVGAFLWQLYLADVIL